MKKTTIKVKLSDSTETMFDIFHEQDLTIEKVMDFLASRNGMVSVGNKIYTSRKVDEYEVTLNQEVVE